MELFKTLLFLLVALLSLGWCCNNCLLSRLEKIPCRYRRPTLTDTPGDNEMGVYHTRFSGCVCHIIRRGHDVTPLPESPANGGRIFHICSPGKLYSTPENYLNQQLTYYNVNCSANQLIYFQLSEMDCEPTKCFDSTVRASKCVDYIQIRTSDGNLISETCGTDISDLNGVIFPFSNIQVKFRSSRWSRYPGFCASAICFSPQSSSKKKRAVSSSSPISKCPATTHKQIRVPHGHSLKIQNTGRSLINITNEETKKNFDSLGTPLITILYNYYMNGTTQISYFQNLRRHRLRYNPGIRHPRVFKIYPGPGILYVPKSPSSSHACYQRYLIDVTEYIPSMEEKQLIGDYYEELNLLIDRVEPPTLGPLIPGDFDYVPPSITVPILPSQIPRPDKILKNIPKPRFGRSALPSLSYRIKVDQISQRVLISAVENEASSSNPIVKVCASGIVNAIEKVNPEKVALLRRRL